jgi:cGMP-dependent protein kinase
MKGKFRILKKGKISKLSVSKLFGILGGNFEKVLK